MSAIKYMTVADAISTIREAKETAGTSAYLWLCSTAGDVILWPDEDSSVGDNGSNAIERWNITDEQENALIDSGLLDEIA